MTQTVDNPAPTAAGGHIHGVAGPVVVVKGDPDQPMRGSSIATKIDTPLIETPRSVTIVDRQTLDDWQAITITQAHDYTVGVTPLDERGPATARGFPVRRRRPRSVRGTRHW